MTALAIGGFQIVQHSFVSPLFYALLLLLFCCFAIV